MFNPDQHVWSVGLDRHGQIEVKIDTFLRYLPEEEKNGELDCEIGYPRCQGISRKFFPDYKEALLEKCRLIRVAEGREAMKENDVKDHEYFFTSYRRSLKLQGCNLEEMF